MSTQSYIWTMESIFLRTYVGQCHCFKKKNTFHHFIISSFQNILDTISNFCIIIWVQMIRERNGNEAFFEVSRSLPNLIHLEIVKAMNAYIRSVHCIAHEFQYIVTTCPECPCTLWSVWFKIWHFQFRMFWKNWTSKMWIRAKPFESKHLICLPVLLWINCVRACERHAPSPGLHLRICDAICEWENVWKRLCILSQILSE